MNELFVMVVVWLMAPFVTLFIILFYLPYKILKYIFDYSRRVEKEKELEKLECEELEKLDYSRIVL